MTVALLDRPQRPAKARSLRGQDPALEDFRAQMGAWVEGRTDREVAELKAFLDTVRVELADLSAPAQDPGPASAWARQLLTHPAETWEALQGEARALLAERAFPVGIEYQAGEFSNPSRSLLLLPPGPLDAPQNEVVHHAGASSNPITNLLTWRRALADLEAAVLHRAA